MLHKRLCRADLKLLVSILWVIWHARNKFVFEGLKIDANHLLPKLKQLMMLLEEPNFQMC